MRRVWRGGVLLGAAVALGVAARAPIAGQTTQESAGVLDEHPAIEYATRPTTDRVAKLSAAIADGRVSLQRQDGPTGYLVPVLRALDIAAESQLLVFSKTGVQRAYTSPHNPRALYFNDSVVVGYVPGAPLLEIASHDPQQGVIFYTIDQTAAAPAVTRRTSCLTCHLTASTLYVPGLLDRSNSVAADGSVVSPAATDVTHATPHPDRWGGWFVTSEDGPAPYSQRAHDGNITFSKEGFFSDQVFVDWMRSAPETHGYLSPFSDVVSLLAFDHETHAINLLTRIDWEWRVAAAHARATASDPAIRPLVDELAEYLLFVREAPFSVPLTPRAGFAAYLDSHTPKDRRGRSFGELQLVTRLLKYPCSWMVYSDAFGALAPELRQAIYRRMIDVLSSRRSRQEDARVSAEDRQAILDILRETKPDFPAGKAPTAAPR